jgi:hypothetical protein
MQAVSIPHAYARADHGVTAPPPAEQTRPAVELGAAASQFKTVGKNPVDPSSTSDKSRDKLKHRESAERRDGHLHAHLRENFGRLVDIFV